MSDIIRDRLAACAEVVTGAIDRTVENLAGVGVESPEKRIFLCNSVLLMVVSITEEGVREILKEYLTLVEELIKRPYENRPALIHTNIDKASSLLRRHNKSKDLVGVKEVVSTIHHFLQDQENYALLKSDITLNEANLKSEEFTALFKQVGVGDIWKLIAGISSVKDFVGVEELEKCKTQAVQTWNEFYFERDAIIHRLSQASGWAPEKIILHCQYIKLVILAASRVLSDDLSEFVVQRKIISEKSSLVAKTSSPAVSQELSLVEVSKG